MFWELYPSKRKKPVARIAWMNMRVHSEEQYALINAAVERYKKTNQWQEENGRYIPDPDTFCRMNVGRMKSNYRNQCKLLTGKHRRKTNGLQKIRSAGQRYLQRKENTDWLVLWGWTGRK